MHVNHIFTLIMQHRDRKPNRLQGFNYSSSSKYYITICVKDFEPIFGEIIEGQMILNDFGRIVEINGCGLQDNINMLNWIILL